MFNEDFFASWSSEMAYVMGFFAADGNMIRPKRGGHFISFHITDKIILESIRKAMQSGHAIGIRSPRNSKEKVQYSLQIGNRKVFEDLQRYGMTPVKSRSLSLPSIPDECISHFIRGYFDGDGCVYFKQLQFADRKNLRWILQSVFTCGSKTFLLDLHTLLKRFGVNGGCIRNKARGYDLLLSHKDSLALYRLMYDTISTADLYLPRKREKFTKAIRTLYPLRP